MWETTYKSCILVVSEKKADGPQGVRQQIYKYLFTFILRWLGEFELNPNPLAEVSTNHGKDSCASDTVVDLFAIHNKQADRIIGDAISGFADWDRTLTRGSFSRRWTQKVLKLDYSTEGSDCDGGRGRTLGESSGSPADRQLALNTDQTVKTAD